MTASTSSPQSASPTSEEELLGNAAAQDGMSAPEAEQASILDLAMEENAASQAPSGAELLQGSEIAGGALNKIDTMGSVVASARDTAAAHELDVDPAEVGSLRSEASMAAFTKAAQEIQADWQAKNAASSATETTSEASAGESAAETTPETKSAAVDPLEASTRAYQFGLAANETLAAANVYNPLDAQAADISSEGLFTPHDWTIQVQRQALTGDPSKLPAVANTVYHEARHAEQWHLMARMKAGENEAMPIRRGKADLSAHLGSKMGMYGPAVTHAVDRPMEMDDPSWDAVVAFYEAAYGSGKDAASMSDQMIDLALTFGKLTETSATSVDLPGSQALASATTNMGNRWNAFRERWFGSKDSYQEAITHHDEVKQELASLREEMAQLEISFAEAYQEYKSRSYEADAFAAGDEVEARLQPAAK